MAPLKPSTISVAEAAPKSVSLKTLATVEPKLTAATSSDVPTAANPLTTSRLSRDRLAMSS
jgi:hypothetical protein